MRCVLEDLVGKRVLKLQVSQDQSVLVVTHDQGRSVYQTYADCCSETWIADIVGVDRLLGQTVLQAVDRELEAVNDGRTRQEEDSFYGIQLRTTGGIVDLVYRNSSNGYYGGGLGRGGSESEDKLIDITEDYSA